MADEPSTAGTRPLLRPRSSNNGGNNNGLTRGSNFALLIGRATGRRGLREPSVIVRETAAVQLEERRADWGYSKPVVALDITWNLVFALVSVVMLASTTNERTTAPIRVWIVGYAIQCVIHVLLVWLEYRRRNRRQTQEDAVGDGGHAAYSDGNESEDEDVEGGGGGYGFGNRSSIAKRCESVNTMASFLWWIVGFYWVVAGGESLWQNAPRLYWLTVVFLAFDVFFAIFCVALACVIGIALCCCLPCIIAILYAVAGQEGASDADISILPRYRFSQTGKGGAGAGTMVPIATSSGDSADDRVLLSEDAECCICLSPYEDGAELHALPCNHNFHASCIVKWLRMNATCPLCKYNILKGNDQV